MPAIANDYSNVSEMEAFCQFLVDHT